LRRAASGGAFAPEPLRATGVGPECHCLLFVLISAYAMSISKQQFVLAVCAPARVWPLPGGSLASQQEAEYSFAGFIPSNKQTNKQTLEEHHKDGLVVKVNSAK